MTVLVLPQVIGKGIAAAVRSDERKVCLVAFQRLPLQGLQQPVNFSKGVPPAFRAGEWDSQLPPLRVGDKPCPDLDVLAVVLRCLGVVQGSRHLLRGEPFRVEAVGCTPHRQFRCQIPDLLPDGRIPCSR